MDGTTEVGALRFQNWPVVGVQSLAFRFEPEDSRTGIYILSFINGERYVGQSLNVVIRFSTHMRRWDDITHLSFRPFLAEELNLREREVLASVEQRGQVSFARRLKISRTFHLYHALLRRNFRRLVAYPLPHSSCPSGNSFSSSRRARQSGRN